MLRRRTSLACRALDADRNAPFGQRFARNGRQRCRPARTPASFTRRRFPRPAARVCTLPSDPPSGAARGG